MRGKCVTKARLVRGKCPASKVAINVREPECRAVGFKPGKVH
jgi:hypothetical protein